MSSSGMSCFMYRLSLSDSKKPPKQLLKRLHVPRFPFLLFCQRERNLFFLVSFRHLQSRPLRYQLTQEIAFPFLSENVHFFAFTDLESFLSEICIKLLLPRKRGSFRNGLVCRGLMRLMHFQASGQTCKPRSKNRSRSQLLLWQDLFGENNHRNIRSIKSHDFALPTLAYSAKYDQIILIKYSAKSGKSIWENLQEMNEEFA